MLIFIAANAIAKDGYTLKVKFPDAPNTKIYLCHYFGKAGTVFKDDSLTTDAKGAGIFKSKTKIVGGIYILLPEDKITNMEIILLNGDDYGVEVNKNRMPKDVKFFGETENTIFYSYLRYLEGYGEEYRKIEEELASVKTKQDSTSIYEKMNKKADELTTFRKGIVAKHPGTFITKLFKALENPDVPKELPIKADGTRDSLYPSRYFKAHFWDDYDFNDDRLIYSPLYESKLKNYMDNWVVPQADSAIVVCDWILGKSDKAPETFKYSLWYLTRWAENSKIMGMDEVFVHLVENYYMKDKAPWVDSTDLAKIIKRGQDIAPNMIGQPAMDIRVRQMDNTVKPLSSVNAPYTLLVFWEADCGHCKKELPHLDSLYKAELKKYGVVIFAVEVSNEVEKWKKFVEENKLGEGWMHLYDPMRETNYKAFYDVYSTPTIYLLDDTKTIVGKRIDHSNLAGLLEYLEKKKAKNNKEN